MSEPESRNSVVEVKRLSKHFPISKGLFRGTTGTLKAVDDVSFHIQEGETLGLVGESGSGKTTLGRCILRAIEPTGGQVLMGLDSGKKSKQAGTEMIDLVKLNKQEMRSYRGDLQMIFQDPYASLDPRMTVLDIVGEPLMATRRLGRPQVIERVKYLLDVVGLEVSHLKRYPHAFSGGQRQRIGIARALAPSPRFIVADEAVSALDVSVQAQILNLLLDIQEKFKIAYLFIAHDLSVVQHISDRVAVMYVGNLVETASSEDLFSSPKHPYTEALLSAVPEPDPRAKKHRMILPGEVANPASPPSGCYFHPRCRYAEKRCVETEPPLQPVGAGRFAACHRATELSLKGVYVTNSD